MKFKIIEKADSILVEVEIPERKLATDPRVHCDIETVKDHLRSEGIAFGEPEQSKFLTLRNTSENSALTGVYKFAKIKKSKTKSRTGNESNTNKRTRTRRTRKQD